MKISKVIPILLILGIVITLAGCDYILTQPELTCDPPNKLVEDIYGNLVCVTTEDSMESNKTSEMTEELPEEEVEDEPIGEESEETPIVGGDKDEHGCIGSAGYTWCEAKQKCIRSWEEICEENGTSEVEEVEISEDVPRKTVTEGDLISFPNLKATDPDGDLVIYTFEEPLDESGEWQTGPGDAGEYITTIMASDGKNEVKQIIVLLVLPSNMPPTIDGISEEIIVEEGDTISLNPVVTDSEGDEVTVTYSGWMTSSSYTTTFEDAGEYEVIIEASDGMSSTKFNTSVKVTDVNRPPKLKSIEDFQVEVGDILKIEPKVEDLDNDAITFTFSEPFNEEGMWEPIEGDAGDYIIYVTANDGKSTDTIEFNLVVGTPNQVPELEEIDDIIVDEGEKIEFSLTATDPEGEVVSITYSGWMTSSSYQTNFEDAGEYVVTVTASDGEMETSQEVIVTVNEVNRAPLINEDWWK